MSQVKAVVFDMDGVLVDTSPIHLQVWSEWFEEAPVDPLEGGPQAALGRRGRDVLAEVLGERYTPESAARIEQELLDREQELLERTDVSLLPGAERLVRAVRRGGHPMALATSADRAGVDRMVARLIPLFDAIVTAEDVERGKPDPEIYLIAARHLELEPHVCVAVEDTVAGVRSARSAGMFVVGVTGTTDRRSLGDAGARRVVDSLEDLVVGGLIGRR